MAIPTFVAGNVLTAAQLNTISTALTITDAWTSYTPTLTQSGAVTKTVTYARYIKVGRMVEVAMRLDITGSGTGANDVVVGLPAFAPVGAVDQPLAGHFIIFDASASTFNTGIPVVASSTTFRGLKLGVAVSSPFYLGSGGFTAALANTDVFLASFSYESTT